ncbi:MAG: DNA repair protein RadC [Saprospiraceae bacterium]|jgi:DNA repair protein RadC
MSSGIKSWAEEDRPREKMILKGRESLSDAELLAILLGSGSINETAVSLARRILADIESLDSLGKKSLQHFMQYRGIGEAKAITIAAALELGRRRQASTPKQKVKITSSELAFQHLGPRLSDLPHEEFWILLLSQRNTVLAQERISQGGMSATVVDPKLIFSKALQHNASGIILFHNHPSGLCNPSQEDIRLTEKLVKAGQVMSIRVSDHLIIGDNIYYSFRDEGMMD